MDRPKRLGSHDVLSGSSQTTASSHYRGTKLELRLRGSGGHVARPIVNLILVIFIFLFLLFLFLFS